MQSLEKRIGQLETKLVARPVEMTAALFYAALRHFNLEAAMPLDGETVDSYLERLPLDTILTFTRKAVHGDHA